MKLLRFPTGPLLFLAFFTQSISSHTYAATLAPFEPASAANGVRVNVPKPEEHSSFEVVGYEAQNAQQSAATIDSLRAQVREAIAQDPKAKYEVIVRMGDDHQSTKETVLDREAYFLARHLADVDPRIRLSTSNIPVSPQMRRTFESQHWFEKNYRMTFTLIRAVISTGATAWTLMATSQLPLGAALSIGLVAGSMSASLQWWSEEFYNGWITKKSGLTANAVSRLPALNQWLLDNDYIPPMQIRMLESAQKWGVSFAEKTDAWLRCYWAEVAYVVVLGVAMSSLGIDGGFSSWTVHKIANDILLTSLMSTVMQDSWDLAITNQAKTAQREALIPSDTIKRRTKGSYLLTGGISMVLMMAKLLHIPYIDEVYIALATSGVGVYGYTLFKDWRSKQNPPDATLSKRIVTSCRVILLKI